MPLSLDAVDAWMLRVAAGDQDAFSLLYDATAPVLSALIGRSAVDEIEQVFLRLWREAPCAGRRSCAFTWMLAVAREVHRGSGVSPWSRGDELTVLATVGRLGYADLARATGLSRAAVLGELRRALSYRAGR
ncbi:hypothetical protein HQQ81_13440 [Microbacteriaceae bacterium VKM Ac-2854]|nr:hypothetical protein [Microbacteriaceae bacterium VKM Ac-2854]